MSNTVFRDYLVRTVSSNRVAYWSVASFCIGVLFFLWTIIKGVFSAMFLPLIVALIINEVVIIYGASQRASGWCVSGVCLLNICAAITQALFEYANPWYFYLAAVVFIWFVAWMMRAASFGKLAVISGLLSIAFLIPCIVMPEVNGARAWLYIGGKPFLQLTEFAKLFYVIFVGCLFISDCSERRKFWGSAFVTGIAMAVLMFCSEFGTLLVIGSAYVCAVLITFQKKMGYKILSVLAVICLIFVAIWGYNTAGEYMDKWTCAKCSEMNQRVTVCTKCDTTAKMNDYNFRCPTCRYTTWGKEKIDNFTKNCMLCREDGFLQSGIGKVCKKLYERGSTAYNYEYQSAAGNAYHAELNLKAINTGGIFGDMNNTVYVPNVVNDSVLAGTMNRLGLVFGLIVLLAFLMIFTSIYRASSPLRIMSVCTFVFQAFYTFAGTLNILPMTGIGIPIMSSGGSNLIVSMVLIYFMISAVRNKEVSK